MKVFSLPSSSNAYSPPSTLISGPDGKLWFDVTLNNSNTEIGRISTKGEFGSPIPASPTSYGYGLFRGPNEQVWVLGSNALSTATRSGIVVVRDLPSQYINGDVYTLNIGGMTAGPDKNSGSRTHPATSCGSAAWTAWRAVWIIAIAP